MIQKDMFRILAIFLLALLTYKTLNATNSEKPVLKKRNFRRIRFYDSYCLKAFKKIKFYLRQIHHLNVILSRKNCGIVYK